MKRQLFLLVSIASILSYTFVQATDVHWDPTQVRRYAQASELQRKWAMRLLCGYRFQGHEHILDIGSGDGKITADISFLVPTGKVIGLDPSSEMLQWAKSKYPSCDFPNLSFIQGDFDSELAHDAFDVVCSLNVLHLVANPFHALKRIAQSLKVGGTLLAVVPAGQNSLFLQAINDTIEQPRWSHWFGAYRVTVKPKNTALFKKYLTKSRFEIVKLQLLCFAEPFANFDDFVHWILGSHREVHMVPAHLQRQFAYEIVERYIELSPSSLCPDGSIQSQFGHIQIQAKKLVKASGIRPCFCCSK